MQKQKMETTSKGKNNSSDYDYIIKTVQYLQNTHGIIFFITTKDFDIIYRWWEKRIPVEIIKKSISNVVKRWQGKKKKVYSFSNFSYEVKKDFNSFLEMNVGERSEEKMENEKDVIEAFIQNYPQELSEIKGDFKEIFQKIKKHKPFKPDRFYEKLLSIFEEDQELNLRTEIFFRGLSTELKKPELEKRYRLNYLLNKFKIPDFDYFSS